VTIRLPTAVRAKVVDHAREGDPREVCGVLAGERGDGYRVDHAIRTRNAADRPRVAYEIPPEELLAVVSAVEDEGRDVVGFYHSHPTGPTEPSATDCEAATWVDHLYLIVALAPDPSVTAWRWTGERFREEPVRIE
jgi:proteasome lid subunit RPN8/RPN11